VARLRRSFFQFSSPIGIEAFRSVQSPHFDRRGEYRDVDNGLAIDSSDVFTMPDGSSVKFTSIEDLAPQLAQSCDVARCVECAAERTSGQPA
jgi:hypothetical protein